LENEQAADAILSALQQLLEAAGPEWTLEFLNAGLAEAGQGGGAKQMPPEPEMMSPGGPRSMGPMTGLGGASRPMPPVRN
jgi:hypothetical protein